MPAAYHCGRLFAELEDIQHQALPGINATIGDKFFGSASASPASVFGILLAGAQNHLSNLRKTREGAYHGAQKRLEEILSEIGDFPTTLPLKEQALFSLGYYHHRAAKRKDIAERSAAKKLATVGEEQ
jgi:CRISPR-associated protein Csd1